jgi:hypothetical protein
MDRAIVAGAVIVLLAMVVFRSDWILVVIPLLYLGWLGHSLFRIVRALVILTRNLLAMRREAA